MRQRRVASALAIPLVLAFVAASCGSDDSSGGDTDTGGEIATVDDTTAVEDTEAPDDAVTATTEEKVQTSVVESTETPEYGGTVTVGLEAETTGLRPWEDIGSASYVNIAHTIFDRLMARNVDGEYEPYLAERLESNADFTEWTMTLRPGVSFSNGSALTAQSIADMFPFQQEGSSASGAVVSSNLIAVEAVDDLTVKYTLSAPTTTFPSFLEGAGLGTVFDPVAAADEAAWADNPIGTGPFVLEKRDINNETIVVKNPNYWRTDADGMQLPYLDSVSFRPIPDEGTRLNALVSDSDPVNAMMTLRAATIGDARGKSGITLNEASGNEVQAHFYNTLRPPFDDLRVRQALNKMTAQDNVIEALGGIGEPATHWQAPGSPYWSQAAADAYLGFDFEAGRALLQEYIDDPARSDGKSPGAKIDVDLQCPPDPTLIAAMQVIQQVWTQSELVNVNLTQFDQQTHIDMALNDDTGVHCWRMSGQGDPFGTVGNYLAPPETATLNVSNYFDQQLVDWVAEGSATADLATRQDLYSNIMTKMNELALWSYYAHTATLIATTPDVKGLVNWTLPSGSLGTGVEDAITRWSDVWISQG